MNLDIHRNKVDEEVIVNMIYLMRGKQVMLSSDLAALYFYRINCHKSGTSGQREINGIGGDVPGGIHESFIFF